ncbi:hypothetical protein, partial [Aeromonas caviae]|uniref:hypothetical protein n=1 Tax=Aeromonas caviae TaxID=648 RepID=UPI0040394236
MLDTLSRIHSLDENSNGDMARLVAVAVLVEAVNAAQGVQHDQPRPGAVLDDAAQVRLV